MLAGKTMIKLNLRNIYIFIDKCYKYRSKMNCIVSASSVHSECLGHPRHPLT